MKIFVYGTLKRGFYNHHFLKDAVLLGQDCTLGSTYDLKEFKSDEHPSYRYPAMLENGSHRIAGEVYEVSAATLDQLDILEEIDISYIRKNIDLKKTGIAQTYIWIGLENPVEPPQNIVNNKGTLTFTNGDD